MGSGCIARRLSCISGNGGKGIINIGNTRKVILSGLSAISGAWVEYTCDRIHLRHFDTLGLALYCTKQRRAILVRLHARVVLTHKSIRRQNRLHGCLSESYSAPRSGPGKSPLPHGARSSSVTGAVTLAGTSCSLPRHQCAKSPTVAVVPAARPGSHVAHAEGVKSRCHARGR